MSCSLLLMANKKSEITMDPSAITIAMDNKKRIVYVLFECINNEKKNRTCGMIVQMNMDLYGDTYIGEQRSLIKTYSKELNN